MKIIEIQDFYINDIFVRIFYIRFALEKYSIIIIV